MANWIQHTCILVLICSYRLGFANEHQLVTYVQDSTRLAYEMELLQHALNLTQDEYGSAKIEQRKLKANIHFEQALAKGEFDVAVLPSSEERERRIQAIKIPLSQGMLSYRLLAVRQDQVTKLATVKTIKDFQTRLIGGVGVRWQTLHMYTRNNLLMRTAYRKSELYQMLVAGEIDYFPRGVNEILGEQFFTKHLKNLTITPDIALFYLTPRYYFVRHGAPELAERIEKGLLKALADGSFKSIFFKHYQDEIDMVKKLKVKKIIYVNNPDITITYPIKWEWWLDKVPAALLNNH